MDAIFGSKLYKTSSRKAEITAAIKDPINTELVKQLRRYLDPEYLKPEYLGEAPEPKEPVSKDTEVVFDKSPSVPNASPSFSSGSSFSDTSSEFSDEELSEEDAPVDTETETADQNEEDVLFDETESESEDESVAESTSTRGLTSITACEDIDSEVIKGTLNSREDCDGVARIVIKNDDTELWIYYKDSVNLNSVMEAVIAFLTNAGYTQLMFSRLARTDNAIVFDIVH